MEDDIQYAGFWSRALASIIDTIWLYGILYAILWAVFGVNILELETEYTTSQFVFEWIIPIAIVMAFWVKFSATPGKMLLNIKIVDAQTHGKVPSGRLFIRYLGYFVSMIPLFLGFIWVAFDSKKQGFHDKISRTVTIKQS